MEHQPPRLFVLLITVGDANAHHQVWRSLDINARGEALLDYLATTELEILNRGSTPTFFNTLRNEVIDITLGLGSLPPRIENWKVSEKPSLSDHAQIILDLRIWSKPGQTLFRNERRTNWSSYRTRLQELIRSRKCRNFLYIEENVSEFILAVTTAFQENCPLTVKHEGRRTGFWNA